MASDALELAFEPGVLPPENPGQAWWFVFHQGRLLVSDHPDLPLVPRGPAPESFGLDASTTHYLGIWDEQHCFVAELNDDTAVPSGFYLEELRRLLAAGMVDAGLFSMVGRASQVLTWARNHRFCSRCGSPARPHHRDRAMVCPECGYTQYPRITPCVIVLVSRDDEILLARSPRFPGGMFSTLAGFMEPGETAEEAVHREVMEETGIRLRNLRYHGSQPWPFPHSLMLGFHADYAGGDIQVDGEEIVEAHWWRRDDLPPIPPRGSIARALIDDWASRSGD